MQAAEKELNCTKNTLVRVEITLEIKNMDLVYKNQHFKPIQLLRAAFETP